MVLLMLYLRRNRKIFLENYLIDIISHLKKVTNKSDNAKKIYQQNAANELADLVEKCVKL